MPETDVWEPKQCMETVFRVKSACDGARRRVLVHMGRILFRAWFGARKFHTRPARHVGAISGRATFCPKSSAVPDQ